MTTSNDMKISVEQARQRAKEISTCSSKTVELAVLQLLEEATGEKLSEPPFDESNLTHLSIWGVGGDPVVFLNDGGEFIGLYASQNGLPSERQWRGRKDAIVERLKEIKSKYLGQYDFAAGLPKEPTK